MAQLFEPKKRNPFERASSLEDLLDWDDVDFVSCAYVTLLGRQPDLPGQEHYLKLLRAGHSKQDLLWRLRQSGEGRAHDPGLRGFDRALKRAAFERRTILGALARVFRQGADRDSSQDRVLRSLWNATMRNHRTLDSIREHLSRQAETLGSPAALAGASATANDIAVAPMEHETIDLRRETPYLDHLRTKTTNRPRKGVAR